MKVPVSVLLSALLVGLLLCPGGVASFPPACHEYALPGCPRNYSPVCGTDGETYSNECVLCLSNRENKKNVQIVKKGNC